MARRRSKKRLLLIPVFLTLGLLGGLIVAYRVRDNDSRAKLAQVQAAANRRNASGGNRAEGEDADDLSLPRFRALSAKNPDMVGWLSIPETEINFPVMYKTGDNDYYLSHDFEGKEDPNGLLVLDKQCVKKGNDTNNLIHGHNTRSDSLFSQLQEYTRRAFYLTHKTIVFSTLYEERVYEIVAVFRVPVDENTEDSRFYEYVPMDDKDGFSVYIQKIREKALYDTGVLTRFGDRMITLSTCEGVNENGRLVVVGRSRK